MTLATSPTPAACSTGTWTQKLACGWHQPTTGAAHLGSAAGHSAGAALIAVAVVVILIAAFRAARRGGKPAPASK
jgi:hypothetical protein